jgi:hypothetical protein
MFHDAEHAYAGGPCSAHGLECDPRVIPGGEDSEF